MKTGNFPSKVNSRRIVALRRLNKTINQYNKTVDENTELIRKHNIVLKDQKDPHISKLLKEQIEEMLVRNKAILSECKHYIKQAEILNSRIVTDEVARSSKSKKHREGRRRSFL